MDNTKVIVKLEDFIKFIKKDISIGESKEIIPKHSINIELSSLPYNLIHNYVRYRNYLPILTEVYYSYGKNMGDALKVFPFSDSPDVNVEHIDIDNVNNIWGESQKNIFLRSNDMEEMLLLALGRSEKLVESQTKFDYKRKSMAKK